MLEFGRRQFFALLGVAASAWPLAARAQQGERLRCIGVLTGLAEGNLEGKARLAGFRQWLQKRGWSEGRNVRIDYSDLVDLSEHQDEMDAAK
jgi:putative ABC transport system substrate-binding protein